MAPKIQPIIKPCSACGRMVARWTNGGRIPPHGKRTVRHKCPHGVWCQQGDPLWGSHSNGRQVACVPCREAHHTRELELDRAKGAR